MSVRYLSPSDRADIPGRKEMCAAGLTMQGNGLGRYSEKPWSNEERNLPIAVCEPTTVRYQSWGRYIPVR